MSERVGFIGLGNMGQPMASNLLKAGFALRVYNRNTSKTEPLVAQGAQRVTQPGDVVEPGGIVVTMVANDNALESVVIGEHGLLERLGPNGIHLSMSTVSPATARKLADLHAKHGSTYLAAPVFGRPDAAAAGKLFICLSGSQAGKERVQPLLHALGQGVYDFGEDAGAANVIKLTGNFLIAAAMEAMAEAFTLAEKNGIEHTKVAYDNDSYNFGPFVPLMHLLLSKVTIPVSSQFFGERQEGSISVHVPPRQEAANGNSFARVSMRWAKLGSRFV
jgi:3-hydroxyisobutyrate dehydrogenase-like beta-hydroxyacid dehydrogenase